MGAPGSWIPLSILPASLLPLLLLIAAASPLASSPLLGVSPQDEVYYMGPLIECRDGSKSFTRDRLNDGYCDCADGTDEPGTSACPESKFYCRNVGDVPHLLFSSRVNDHICDCCDGSDEYDGGISCSKTCMKDGSSILNNYDDYDSIAINLSDISLQEKKTRLDLEDLIQKLKGLRIVIMVEFGVVMCVLTFCIFYRRTRSRRRQYSRRNYLAPDDQLSWNLVLS